MYYKQKGMSAVVWLAILGVLAVVITCSVKMIPAYLELPYVEDALKSIVKNNDDLEVLGKREITSQLRKYSDLNALGDEASGGFVVKRIQGGHLVTSAYEVRRPIFMNVDVIMSFQRQLDTTNPDACCDVLIEDWNVKN